MDEKEHCGKQGRVMKGKRDKEGASAEKFPVHDKERVCIISQHRPKY